MTPGGNNFNDFLEIVPTREITIKTEKTFLVFSRPWPWNYFFDGSNAAAYNRTHLNPAPVTGLPSHRHTELHACKFGGGITIYVQLYYTILFGSRK